MAWRKLTEDDLVAFLSQKEVDAYRRSADFSPDVIAAILTSTGNFVRGHVRASGVSMSPASAPAIPDSLVSPALDYAVYDVLKRMKVAVGEDRRTARAQAIELFKRVADGKMAVEPEFEADASGGSPAKSPAYGIVHPARLLD